MEEKLEELEKKYDEIEEHLANENTYKDSNLLNSLLKEKSLIEESVLLYRELKKVEKEIEDTKKLINEPDMEEIAKEELTKLQNTEKELMDKIIASLIEKDERDERDIIMEIRAAAGGEEAALFAADLFRMYSYYAEKRKWKVEIIDSHPTDIGGYKEIIFSIKGKNVFGDLKYESGVHRVQRVPVTEASGRIHTSTVTVAVLPEVEEVDIDINPDDLRIDVFRASGHGGQCVQKTESAVRITHIPTGFVATCQDERSQLKNKEKALRVLRARLYDYYETQKEKEVGEERKKQIGWGERSEKIRTYNFPQNRVTDHRIGLSLYNLAEILEGNLDELINALKEEDKKRKIENLEL
ncbi:MAG TPA: peptide chain release factor 1 [Caldisericia bacterium]|nr:peptide chain release factor 1 [Caldisericia bacterium]HPB33189.1 peptide chain release factor 1 [Caldisericia bacterium]HQL66721.1 peptide chain release factor 1 [Caldisericia bacterium]HQN47963.1 peptide chain release factor 1 [Caldisericia bacterium]HQO99047.1 peptide chain release factor 1 [Caldisericia bacterium]